MSKNSKNLGYTIVPNSILWNNNLRLEEKALLAILISNSEDWHIYISEIYSRSENKQASQRRTFQSLIKKGYASQIRYVDPGTKQIGWKNIPYPDGNANALKNPAIEFPEMETPAVGNPSDETLSSGIPNVDDAKVETPQVESHDNNSTNEDSIKEENTKEDNTKINDVIKDIEDILLKNSNAQESHTRNSEDGSDKSSEETDKKSEENREEGKDEEDELPF
ncbi:hypothetical protein [Aurantibacillus circumpalustris]|uniref:hypothetical protein n=1 Tax=Aurantibacillus circumpalustris TaxID=3036359 RepID=UPI00295BEC1C|nr:hypothetical protein [Aurantibacillus circumpalustris]